MKNNRFDEPIDAVLIYLTILAACMWAVIGLACLAEAKIF